jgi:hypothetical protein
LRSSGPSVRSSTARSIARPTAGGNGTRTILVPLPTTSSTPVAVLLAEVGDVGGAGLEDPQPEQPEDGDQGEVVDVARLAGWHQRTHSSRNTRRSDAVWSRDSPRYRAR